MSGGRNPNSPNSPIIPPVTVPIADKAGKITMPWQRYLLALRDASQAGPDLIIDSDGNTFPGVGQIDLGNGLTASGSGGPVTISAATGGGGIAVAGASGIVREDASEIIILGDVLVGQSGENAARVFIPALGVSGFTGAGDFVDYSTVHAIEFTGNAYLADQAAVDILGIINTSPIPEVVIPNMVAGGAWVYIEFNEPISPPPWVSLGAPLENINDCRLYYSAINSSFMLPVTLSSGGEGDCVAQVVTSPADLISSFGATMTSGLVTNTISIPVNPGRVVMGIIDQNVRIPITISSTTAFDTSIVSTMSSGTEPNPTGVLLSADIDFTGNLELTVSSSSSFSAPAYMGVLLTGAPGPPDMVTVVVPPLELISQGSIISENLWEMITGTNITATGAGHTGTLSAFSTLQSAGTVANGQMVALDITGPGAMVSSAGEIGTINIPGVDFSGTNITDIIPGPGIGGTVTAGTVALTNTGVLALGTGTGTIGIGTGLSLSSGILNATGGGGGGGGGINFGSLVAPTASQTLLVYPVGSSGLTLSAGLPGSSAYAETAPTAAVTITLYENATAIGTVNWAAGSNDGTITFTAGVAIPSGGVLTAKAQAIPDTAFANFGVVLIPTSPATNIVFGVNQATNQSIPRSTFTKIAFDTIEFDPSSSFSFVNSRFQPSAAGYYQLSGGVHYTSGVSLGLCSIFKNGVEFKRGTQGALTGANVSTVVHLNGSGDYAEIYAYADPGISTDASTPALVYFSGASVG